MSAEETLRALMHSAAATLRSELREATIEALVEDLAGGFRRLLRQAYDLGYREGLAARPGAGEPAAPAPAAAVAHPTEPGPPPADDVEPEGAEVTDDDDADDDAGDERADEPSGVRWDDADEGDPAAAGTVRQERPRHRPAIRPSATVGRLMARINKHFGLERFDIELVVYRRGDRDKRQLNRKVRLSRYLVEE